MSVFEILDGAKFPETTVDVCMRQDLDLKLRDLYRRQSRLSYELVSEASGDTRLGSRERDRLSEEERTELDEIEVEVAEVEDEMSASTLTFHLRGVSPAEYGLLQRTAGRPRQNDKADEMLGYNIQAFFENAVKRCCFKVTAPDGSEAQFTDEHWKQLFKSINDAQFDDLCKGVETVNRKKARSVSKDKISDKTTESEPKPEPPTGLESLTNGSSGGNQKSTQG